MVGTGHQGKLLALGLTVGRSLMDWSSFLSKVRRSWAGPWLIGRDPRNNAVSRRLLHLAHDLTESVWFPLLPKSYRQHQHPLSSVRSLHLMRLAR